jgi:hypothetical protein
MEDMLDEVGTARTALTEIVASPWVGLYDDLNQDDRLAVAQLVFDGGAVVGNATQLARRLRNARLLALLRDRETVRIVGVAALKIPDPGYRLNNFGNAGVAITGYESAPELGYVVVAGDMRGRQLSSPLLGSRPNPEKRKGRASRVAVR